MEAPPFLNEAGEPRAFVIVSSARSGSNLLVSYLRQVQRAACLGEIFRERFPEKPGWGNLVTRFDLPDTARRLHAQDLTGFWELILSRGLARRGWLGAKAFHYHRATDPLWDRFAAPDHRVLHLVRDSVFDQYVSRLLAVESGAWKAGDHDAEPRVAFDRDDYLRFRARMATGVERVRNRYGHTDRYVEIEYRQLNDHAFMAALLRQLFGEQVAVEERRTRQRGRPKLEYLRDPGAGAAFAGDSLSSGFAEV